MKDKILNAATDMFLSYGFKSVTMDDIAEKIGVSKKTIYANYATKSKLVQAASVHLFETIKKGIQAIQSKGLDPVSENYEMKRFVMFHLKDEKATPHYQLKKYYPRIFEEMITKQYELLQACVISNLERGIQQGCYRKDIPIHFISRIYFVGMMGIKDKELFPVEEYSENQLMEYFLEYHLRAICTEKGFKTLEEFISKHEK